jgi:hypothetical protein
VDAVTDWGERVMYIIFGLLGIGMLVAIYFAAREAEHVRRRCTDNGGTWVRVNCREVESDICSTTDYGNNTVITTCIPDTSTVCDRVCRGAAAEVVTPEVPPHESDVLGGL